MERRIFYRESKAREAASEFAARMGADIRKGVSGCNPDVYMEDNEFSRKIVSWSGEKSAYYVERGLETLGVFAYWCEDWELDEQ